MSSDDQRKSVKYGDSSKFTNWILDSGATCHMTPEVSYIIPGTLEDTDKYIEVADGHHVTAKQKGQVQIQTCDDNGKSFIATLYMRNGESKYVLIKKGIVHATKAKMKMTIRYMHLWHGCLVMTNTKV